MSTSESTTTPRSEADDPKQPRRTLIAWLRARSGTLALLAFGAYIGVAFFVLILHYGADLWFLGDDWRMLTSRELGEPTSWFRPQNGHWLLLPSVLYAGLFRLFGLASYAPYQTVLVTLHLTLAGLIRITLRRCGVGPWTASIVAGTFVLFGTGYTNIARAIQMGPLLSLVFGYTQLLLADHDGPVNRRDWLGVAAGCVAITSSGVGLAMLVAAGAATLVRRGWRIALLHTAPGAALFLVWYTTESRAGNLSPDTDLSVRRLFEWGVDSTTGAFEAITQSWVVAALLGLVTIAGLLLAWGRLDLATLRQRAGLPTGLVLAALAIPALASTQRSAYGVAQATSARYMGWVVALLLPVIGIAIYAIVERWRFTAPVVLGLLVVGVPGNVADLRAGTDLAASWAAPTRAILEAAAYSPLADTTPDEVLPNPRSSLAPDVTMGFLTAARESGRLPRPETVGRRAEAQANAVLQLAQLGIEDVPEDLVCRRLFSDHDYEAVEGQQFAVRGAVDVTLLDEQGRPAQEPIVYRDSGGGPTLTVVVPELRFSVSPHAQEQVRWCD